MQGKSDDLTFPKRASTAPSNISPFGFETTRTMTLDDKEQSQTPMKPIGLLKKTKSKKNIYNEDTKFCVIFFLFLFFFFCVLKWVVLGLGVGLHHTHTHAQAYETHTHTHTPKMTKETHIKKCETCKKK